MRALQALPTPSLLLDRARLRRNCARMRELAARHGVALRPHLKTSKCIEVAFEALGEGPRLGTVSTLDEAAYFRARGITDLIYAVAIVPARIDQAAALGVTVVTDDVGVAQAIGGRVPALIEIDSGQHRTGIAPDDPALLEIARALGPSLRGVLTHAGHGYGAQSVEVLRAIAEEERRAVVSAQARLREAGFDAPVVSAGSTPTLTHAESLQGVSEIRPGVYVFGDLCQAALGSCARDDIAVSVLARVVSRQRGRVWIDAGALALSQDASMSGFGEVCDADLVPLPGAPRVAQLNQVHGLVDVDLAPGSLVRVLPNHACHTAAMFDRYNVIEQGEVVAEWPRLRG